MSEQEKTASDAPVYLSAGEAGAWASGYNSALAARPEGRWCPPGHVLVPMSVKEAEMMNLISSQYLKHHRDKTFDAALKEPEPASTPPSPSQVHDLEAQVPRQKPFDPCPAAAPPGRQERNGIRVAKLHQNVRHDLRKGSAFHVGCCRIEYVMALQSQPTGSVGKACVVVGATGNSAGEIDSHFPPPVIQSSSSASSIVSSRSATSRWRSFVCLRRGLRLIGRFGLRMVTPS